MCGREQFLQEADEHIEAAESLTLGMIRFIAEVKDQTHRSRSFTLTLDVQPEDVALLNDAAQHQRVMRDITKMCTAKIVDAEPWMCSARSACRCDAVRMLNAPGYWPKPADGGLPVIRDMCPILVCDDPVCLDAARALSQDAIRSLNTRGAPTKLSPAPNSAPPTPGSQCSQCGKKGSELKRCGRCNRAWYCDAECQKVHWKVHKPACETTSPK